MQRKGEFVEKNYGAEWNGGLDLIPEPAFLLIQARKEMICMLKIVSVHGHGVCLLICPHVCGFDFV